MYNVLFIEDDLVDQMAAMRVLKKAKLDLKIHKVNNIEEATALLQEQKFDLVISDYHLADGTAVDLRENIQQTPLVLITGLREEELVHQANSLGAVQFIRKDQTLDYLNALPSIIQEILPMELCEATANKIASAKVKPNSQIDISQLHSLFDGNKEAIAEIIQTFLTQNPIDLQQLKEELASKNMELVKKIAHKIKSRYNMFGLKEQAVTAATIEEQITKNTYVLEDISSKLDFLDHSSQYIYLNLEKHLLP